MSRPTRLRRPALARPLLNEAQRAPDRRPRRLRAARLPRRRRRAPPDRTALAYFDGRLSYREADELSDSVAGHLAARGFGRGDRVAVMLQNTPHFVLALLGAWKAGATVVPVNPMYKSGEVGARPARRRGRRAGLLRPRLGRRICARPPPTRRCGSCSPPASWTSRPATTRAC